MKKLSSYLPLVIILIIFAMIINTLRLTSNTGVQNPRASSTKAKTTPTEEYHAPDLREIQILAEHGDPEAQFYLGVVYDKGKDMPQNFEMAAKWYKRAAEQGIPEAHLNLGLMYAKGEGVPHDAKMAREKFYCAANLDDDVAQYYLGIMYGERGPYQHTEQGDDVLQSVLDGTYEGSVHQRDQESARWLKHAAKKGFPIAQYYTSKLYYTDAWEANSLRNQILQRNNPYGVSSVTYDPKMAAKHLRLAAKHGHADAQFQLGMMHRSGWYTKTFKQNNKTAAEWISQAAAQGHPNAEYMMGRMTERGGREGMTQDYEAAVQWYWRAAMQGHAIAQFALGAMYHEGRGVSQDYKKAANWFQRAGKQEDINAQYNLGVAYYKGEDVPQDYKKAAQWLRLAAEQSGIATRRVRAWGWGDKQENVTQDDQLTWFQCTAKQGDTNAGQNICNIKRHTKTRGVPSVDPLSPFPNQIAKRC